MQTCSVKWKDDKPVSISTTGTEPNAPFWWIYLHWLLCSFAKNKDQIRSRHHQTQVLFLRILFLPVLFLSFLFLRIHFIGQFPQCHIISLFYINVNVTIFFYSPPLRNRFVLYLSLLSIRGCGLWLMRISNEVFSYCGFGRRGFAYGLPACPTRGGRPFRRQDFLCARRFLLHVYGDYEPRHQLRLV